MLLRAALAFGATTTLRALLTVMLVTGLMMTRIPEVRGSHALEFHWALSQVTVRLLSLESWMTPARTAAGYWNGAEGPTFYVGTGSRGCDSPPKGVVTVCFAPHHSITHVHLPVRSDDHLTRAWIHVAPRDVHAGPGRRTAIMCQELGHVLGLDHRYSGPSCMRSGYYTAPDQHDLGEVAGIYDHRWGYRHRHHGYRHVHRKVHCHVWVAVCLRNHKHRNRHWHAGYSHWHSD